MKIFKLLLLIACSNAFAQQFTVSSKLSGVEANGLHTFSLSPDFRLYSDCNPDGIRIYDSKDKEVPYAWAAQNIDINAYLPYPMYVTRTDSTTSVIIDTGGRKMNTVTLAIANTDAHKSYTVSGSSNKTDWFGLVNNRTLSHLYSTTDTIVYTHISLPLHSYHYLKIDFSDKNSLPLNIVSAGMIMSGYKPQQLHETHKPRVKIVEAVKNKKTRISVKFEHPVIVNEITFTINGPEYYKRTARVLVPQVIERKRKKTIVEHAIQSFELSSYSTNIIGDLQFTEDEFVIEIDNGDNRPLDISSVKFYQEATPLIAYLEKGEHYTVKGGNPQLGPASYDLEALKNDLPKNMPVAVMSSIETMDSDKAANKKDNPWIMWVCIIAGTLVVAYFCYSLVKDMKNKENSAP